MKPPKLSVIMPNYNHAKYIAEALEAVVTQSFEPFEVIVCDDGSTDNSVEIIQRFVDKYHFVRLIRNETNLGANKTSNKLFTLISGDYVYGAAADDKVLPGFFEKSMNLLQKYPQAGLCSTLARLIDENGNHKDVRLGITLTINDSFIESNRAKIALYKYGSWIGGGTTIFKRSALIENGGFIEKLHSYSDSFIEQVIAVKYGVCFVPEALMCWRVLYDGYGMATRRNFDVRMETIKNVTDLMKGIFPAAYISKWRINELFSLKKDELLSYRERDLSNIEKNDSGSLSKIIDKFRVNIVFVSLFLGILTYFMLRYGRYFNIVTKIYYRYQKHKIV